MPVARGPLQKYPCLVPFLSFIYSYVVSIRVVSRNGLALCINPVNLLIYVIHINLGIKKKEGRVLLLVIMGSIVAYVCP